MLKLPPPPESAISQRQRRRARALTARESVPPRKWYVAVVGNAPNDANPMVPDLLHAEPLRWGDLQGLAQLVRFSFEGGECTGAFDAIRDSRSLWQI